MRHRIVLIAALVAALAAIGAAPVARAQSDALHTLEAIFQSFDDNHDGVVSPDETSRYIDKSFKEMDPRGTGVITRDNFVNYSIGLSDVAAQQGVSDAYERAKAANFERWSGGKNSMTLEQYRRGVLADVRAVGGDKGMNMQAFTRTKFIASLIRSVR